MSLDGSFANNQALRDFTVAYALSHEHCDLTLTRS